MFVKHQVDKSIFQYIFGFLKKQKKLSTYLSPTQVTDMFSLTNFFFVN